MTAGREGASGTGGLRDGTVAEAGLDPARVERARAAVRAALPPYEGSGCFPGGVLVLAANGVVAVHEAYGEAVRYAADGTVRPDPERVPATTGTVYDLASLTKTVTAIVLLAAAERGLVGIDQPVRTLLPAFDGADRHDVPVSRLLDHTAGFPAIVELWHDGGSREEAYARAARVPLAYPPGTDHVYSDVGPILTGALLERRTGSRLDELVADLVTGPLGLTATGYRPDGSVAARCAATEAEPWVGRPLLRGEVHDENAWFLGGVAGHAGLFGTAADYARIVAMLLGGGTYAGRRVLTPESVDLMLADRGASNGLGADVDRPATMGELASPAAAGHTGFTGTSYVLDRATRAAALLFTNRVHPTRDRGVITPTRVAVAESLLVGTGPGVAGGVRAGS